MKKRVVAKIKVQKVKRAQKRARYRGRAVVKDPKDLRGAKGALLENAVEAAREEEAPAGGTAEQRHAPRRINSD